MGGQSSDGADLTRILWPQLPVTAIREIKMLKVLNHKNVVQLKEIVTSKGVLCQEGGGRGGWTGETGAWGLRDGQAHPLLPRNSLSQQASIITARGRSTWSWSLATTISRGLPMRAHDSRRRKLSAI